MPQSNGKIWADVVNGVKRGISTADVSICLGENSLDDGTLCLSNKINKAALFCPRYVRRPGIELRENGAFSATALAYIKGQTSQIKKNYAVGPYGVCLPDLALHNFAQTSAVFDRIFACGRASWYISRPNAPTGSLPLAETSFKVLSHFDGYDHNAKITLPVSSVTVTVAPNGDKEIAVVFTTSAADGSTLSITNLFGGRGYYFGVIVFRGTNADGWLVSDVVHLSTGSTAIGTNAATYTVNVTDDATGESGYYRIVPFVTDKPGVSSATAGTIAPAFEGKVAYGIRIDDTCGSVFTLQVNNSSSGGSAVQNYVFNWKEGNNGNYYPVPGNNSYTYTLGSDGPAIAIYFSESTWYKELGCFSLLAALKRLDIILPYRDAQGKNVEGVFTWSSAGSTHGNGTLFRESKYNDADKLFFYLKPAVANPILNQGHTDIVGRFYWIDGTTEELFATYIPDLAGN